MAGDGQIPEVDPRAALAIATLIADYFAWVDRPGSHTVADLFTEDATLVLGTARIEGRVSISAFLAGREAHNTEAKRIVRHISNLPSLRSDGANRITGRSTAVVFAGSGDLPLTSAPPSTICDFDDIYVAREGRWLFERRVATVLFVGASAAIFAK